MPHQAQHDWSDIRGAFPVCKDFAYLNCGTFGPSLDCARQRSVSEMQREVLEGRSNTNYYERLDNAKLRVRSHLANLIGAGSDELALTTSTTGGCQIVVQGLELPADAEILTTDLEHHTFLTALRASKATVRIIKISHLKPGDEAEPLKQAINDKTKLIALSHVSWIDGRVMPVSDLSGLGPPILVDGAQSVGAIALDVNQLKCDFVTFPGQKWLLGPDATGGLYVARRWHERLKIALPSYYGHDSTVDSSEDVPLDGAVRFEPGPIALPMIGAWETALDFCEPLWGSALEHAKDLCRVYRDRLNQQFEVLTYPAQSTLLVFNPGEDAEQANDRLAEHHVVTRTITGRNWLRVSVGFWNNEEDLERLMQALRVQA